MLGRVTLAGAAATLAPLVAAAERPVDVALEWRAGDGCSDAVTLRERVRPRLRRNRLADRAELVIRGASRRAGDGRWRADIEVVGGDGAVLGDRALIASGDDCGELDDAVVVVLAMIVDASLAAARPAAPDPVPQVIEDERPPDPRPAPAPEGWGGSLSATAMTEVGRLPGANVGAELLIRVEPPRLWPLEVGISGWTEAAAEAAEGGSTFRQLAGVLLTCPLRWRVELCGGAQLGAIDARGFGFLDNRRDRALIADARVELRAGLALGGGWFARVAAGAWIPLVRPSFSFERSSGVVERLYTPAQVAGIAHLGVGARFR